MVFCNMRSIVGANARFADRQMQSALSRIKDTKTQTPFDITLP